MGGEVDPTWARSQPRKSMQITTYFWRAGYYIEYKAVLVVPSAPAPIEPIV